MLCSIRTSSAYRHLVAFGSVSGDVKAYEGVGSAWCRRAQELRKFKSLSEETGIYTVFQQLHYISHTGLNSTTNCCSRKMIYLRYYTMVCSAQRGRTDSF